MTNNDIVGCLVQNEVHVVAVTDHHVIDVSRVKELQRLGGENLTVLPAIELRDDHGGEPIHYICIFPHDCDLEHVWTTLQGTLGLTENDVRTKGGDQKVYVPIEKGAQATRQLGGVVSIHAGRKSNSIEGIQNREEFQQRIKYDITREWVDLMEIGQLKDIDTHLDIIFPATGLDRPLIICSDNHNIRQYVVKTPLWLRADPTFRGLLMALREPRDRVYIGKRPSDLLRVEQNKTKFIRSISFQRKDGLSADEKWFSGAVAFSHGLVAIIGNKGSGKSALSDTLGLLGATKTAGSLSFLHEKRFRHHTRGPAVFFDAMLEWESGEKVPRCLNDDPKPEDVERVRYLPQDHIEKVCNEIVGIGEEGFEQELKSVIFSFVSDTKRLGNATLDELVGFQAGEKQKRIDSLLKQLKDANRRRAVLEAQTDPIAKRALEEKIKRREIELEAHDKGKPKAISNPATSPESSTPDPVVLTALTTAESTKKTLIEQIATATNTLRSAERQQAVAKRLLEKLDNFQKDFDVFRNTLEGDATELGLQVGDLVALSITRGAIESCRDAAAKLIESTKTQLDGGETPGVRAQLGTIEAEVANLQSRLDARNREYQTYLAMLGEWQEKRTTLEGSETDPESLKGLQRMLSQMGNLPAKIVATKREQSQLALDIHAAKIAQSAVYRDLYGAVQDHIDTHVIAKDKLKLEFRVELVCERFTDRLLNLMSLNRRGSFMGVDEGRTRADALVQSTDWEDARSVSRFLRRVDLALHKDQREGRPPRMQLKDQVKGKKPEEVFDLLYGLEYIRPKYILRWENKDISMLSAGERGTLLLVFYLLVDQGDMPLIIDQPEGNLDNHTVARVLVDCIKEARGKRQVFIVTHNPNLAVVCDADQVVHAAMDKTSGNAITYTTGSLENPAMSQYITDVLEGTRWAFGVRDAKYKVSER